MCRIAGRTMCVVIRRQIRSRSLFAIRTPPIDTHTSGMNSSGGWGRFCPVRNGSTDWQICCS